MVCDPLALTYMHGMAERQEGMAGAAAQQRFRIAALWLVLVAIFAHALLPVGSPIERISGSAFSAATSDVSLAPARAAAAQDEDALGDLDGTDPPAWADPVTPMSATAPVAAQAPTARQPFLAGHPAAPGARPYAPRAPPSS